MILSRHERALFPFFRADLHALFSLRYGLASAFSNPGIPLRLELFEK